MPEFIDEVTIHISAGHGGPGSVSFRKEKFVEFGGPDGGDGGTGGNVYIISSERLQTLDVYQKKLNYSAKNGHPGSSRNRTGANGDDLTLKVPVGTQAIDSATGETIHDFLINDEKILFAKGGRGGKGNAFFKSSTHQTPRFAQDGEPGEEKEIILNLKLLADVGIVGFPNAGKSTLLSKITEAHPKIAGYAFTTLVPNLGVVYNQKDGSRYTIADIPGIIEGAHKGLGLGLSFLKHIERVSGILYLIDCNSNDMEDDFKMLQNELQNYNKKLLKKPALVAINKIDLWGNPDDFIKEWGKKLNFKDIPIVYISAEENLNLDKLLKAMNDIFFQKSVSKKIKTK